MRHTVSHLVGYSFSDVVLNKFKRVSKVFYFQEKINAPITWRSRGVYRLMFINGYSVVEHTVTTK